MLFTKIYENLCNNGKSRKDQYKPKSGLHKHHIHPTHSGGEDSEDNYTYLTSREHTIAHYCLWKINNNPNDLRSMKMLGVQLTPHQRRKTGEFCRDNKLGFFGASIDDRRKWAAKGLETQKISANPEKTYWYWSTPEGRQHRARLGGTASMKSPKSKWKYWTTKEGHQQRASMGGSALGKQKRKAMHLPGTNKFIRVLPSKIAEYKALGYKLGSGKSPNLGIKTGPSKRRKPLTDGIKVWAHAKEAAAELGLSLAMISLLCNGKIKSKPNWRFISLDEYESGL